MRHATAGSFDVLDRRLRAPATTCQSDVSPSSGRRPRCTPAVAASGRLESRRLNCRYRPIATAGGRSRSRIRTYRGLAVDDRATATAYLVVAIPLARGRPRRCTTCSSSNCSSRSACCSRSRCSRGVSSSSGSGRCARWRRPPARSRPATSRSASRSWTRHTEVGRLGHRAQRDDARRSKRAFAERAASEARLRRFVGDASHELRTPLTSIRGYAELFRRGAAERPEDLAKAMRRIEEEADRMGVLVDDLLLLARLDQGRPLEHAAGRPHAHHRRRGRRHRARSRRTGRSSTRRTARSSCRRRGAAAPGARQPAAEREPPHAARHARARRRHERRHRGGDRSTRRRPGHAARRGRARVRAVLARRPVAGAHERRRRASASRSSSAIADAHGGRAEVVTAPGEGATFRIASCTARPSPRPTAAAGHRRVRAARGVAVRRL